MLKEVLGVVAVAVALYAFIPYIQSIRKGRTRPHVFSWVIWGLTTFIVFLAQMVDGGGPGAWSTAVSGLVTFYVAWLAFSRHADSHITRSDWVFFTLALAALPLWFATADPLWAVVVLTAVDALGFIPTIRKAYGAPFEEQLGFYGVMALRNVISIFALEHYSLTTVLFPAVIAALCVLFIPMVLYRRQVTSAI